MKIRLLTGLLTISLLALNSCGSKNEAAAEGNSSSGAAAGAAAGETQATNGAKDIVDTAVAAGSFVKLADLLSAAGLVDTLKGEGPFTVFAPTDAAFAKVDKATLAGLAADTEKLKGVLTYHVHAGKVMAADVEDGMAVPTVQGSNATISVADGNVMIDGARITKTDIECSNGVIHVIDAVILPK